MLIVGELINSSRQAIATTNEARDRAFLQNLARGRDQTLRLAVTVQTPT